MRAQHALGSVAALAALLLPFTPHAPAPSSRRPASTEVSTMSPVHPSGQAILRPSTDAPTRVTATNATAPRFAYYYIWFTRSSWRRAKSDLPLLGRYESGDATVIRQHIRWAKAAGIDGFIVSWKHTTVLDERLATLVDVAEQEHFSLAIIYQGLDFHRNPLPVSDIEVGLRWFDQHLASRAPFTSSGTPMVIWSGTWKFSRDDIASVTAPLRSDLRILGSAKNRKDYLRIADAVDGNAYYWSSVNPATYDGYAAKLQAMADAVHAHGGLWIAPAAVGFDAHMLGGKTTVERSAGATFRSELTAASSSSPDLIGLISWNEFSENSHIEPSERYGTCALGFVAISAGLPAPQPGDCSRAQAAGLVPPVGPAGAMSPARAPGSDMMDSSSPGTGAAYGPYVAGGFGLFLIIALSITVRGRQRLRAGMGVASDSPTR